MSMNLGSKMLIESARKKLQDEPVPDKMPQTQNITATSDTDLKINESASKNTALWKTPKRKLLRKQYVDPDRNQEKIYRNRWFVNDCHVMNMKIVCTGYTKKERNAVKSTIETLGFHTFHNIVEPYVFLLVKYWPDWSLHTILAIAYGCQIISREWIDDSRMYGRWTPWQEYAITNLPKPVRDFQKKRYLFGMPATFHIFHEAGRMYFSKSCRPSASILAQLVRDCGGMCTSSVSKASIVIGKSLERRPCIKESWILKSIRQGKMLDKNKFKYAMKNMSYEDSDSYSE